VVWVVSYGVVGFEVVAPLGGESVGDAGERPGALFPAVGAGRHQVDPLALAAGEGEHQFADIVGRGNRRETFQPQAGGLLLRVAVLEGLDDLVGLPDAGGNYADGVLQGDVGDRGVQQAADEIERLLLNPRRLLGGEVPGTGDGQMGAGRVEDAEHRPDPLDSGEHVILDVELGVTFAGQEVAGPSGEASGAKSVADDAGIFAADEDR